MPSPGRTLYHYASLCYCITRAVLVCLSNWTKFLVGNKLGLSTASQQSSMVSVVEKVLDKYLLKLSKDSEGRCTPSGTPFTFLNPIPIHACRGRGSSHAQYQAVLQHQQDVPKQLSLMLSHPWESPVKGPVLNVCLPPPTPEPSCKPQAVNLCL